MKSRSRDGQRHRRKEREDQHRTFRKIFSEFSGTLFWAKVTTKDDDRSLGKKGLKPLFSLRAKKPSRLCKCLDIPPSPLKPSLLPLKSAIICHHIPFSHLKASDEDDKETSFSFTHGRGKACVLVRKEIQARNS